MTQLVPESPPSIGLSHGRAPRAWLVGLAVLTVTLAAYLPALDGPFIWDDLQLIFDSPRVMEIQPLRAYWGSSFWTRGDIEPIGRNYYRPLSIFSLALDHYVHGVNPGGYHLTNGAFHAGSALLLFVLLRRRKLETISAGLLAMAWSCFPRLTEAAAWISGRTDVLATFFVLLGLLCAGRKHPVWRWAAAFSVLAALFAKEVALAGLCAVAILELQERRMLPIGRRSLRLFPIAVAGAAYFIARAWAMGLGLRENGLPWGDRALAALEATGRYVWMTIDGWHPMIHIGHLGSHSIPFITLGGVALVCLLGLAWHLRQRLVGEQLAFTAMLTISVLLVLHIVPITINVVVADRFMYLPLAALSLCLAPLVARSSFRHSTLALSLLGASYAPVTFARAGVWADEVVFWTTAFREQSTHNAQSRLELGNVYGRAGLQSYALALYLDANDEDYTNYLLARHNAGTRLIIMGRYSDAKTILEDLVHRSPEIPKFHFSLASSYLTEGRYDESEKELDIALRLYPESISARRLKRMIARQRQSLDAAPPDLTTVQGKLDQVSFYAQRGRHKEALEVLLSASAAPDISLVQLTEGVLYTFDWGTPKQLTTLYERYRAHGGSAPAIIDNYEMRMERVRRLRALWPSLGNGQPAPTGT